MLNAQTKILPSFGVVACILSTVLLSTVGFQTYASWKLGLPIRVGAGQLLALLEPGEPAAKADASFTPDKQYRNQPFTDEPIFFCGDSQILEFCECEAVTENPVYFFRRACVTRIALDHLAEGGAANVVVVHLGTMDVLSGPCDTLIRDYRKLLERLKNKEVLVLLPEPVNEEKLQGDFFKGLNNSSLQWARCQIRALCADFPNVRMVDITPRVADPTGNGRPEFFTDGLHFNGLADDIWWKMIRHGLRGWVKERAHKYGLANDTTRGAAK